MNRLHVLPSMAVLVIVLSVEALAPMPALAAEVEGRDPMPSLELLFELSLPTEGAIRPYVEADQRLDRSFSMSRDLVAQGEGHAKGKWLHGDFRWSLLARRYPGSSFGRLHLTGWLESEDGAELFFRATGYGHDDASRVSAETLLTLTGGFEVELEPAYEWLNGVVALIDGRLDTETNTFHYRAWVPSEVLERRAPTE